MKKNTTIAVSTDVLKRLLKHIHKMEKKDTKRFSYSNAIEDLLDKVKEIK